MVSKELEKLIIQIKQNKGNNYKPSVNGYRESFDQLAKLIKIPEDAKCESVNVEGIPAEWISVPETPNRPVILYFHGGGYVAGSIDSHRGLGVKLARASEEREGYYHLTKMEGNAEEATARMLIRDFELENNQRRMNYLKSLKHSYELRYPGLKIDLDFKHQYLNMLNYIEKNIKVIKLAKKSIEKAGLEVKIHSIRGGTDGAQLSARGIITPNIFTGGEFFHSRKEFIPTIALQKVAEVLIYLSQFWAESE